MTISGTIRTIWTSFPSHLSVADSFDDFVITGNGTKIVTVTHGADSIIVTSAVAFTLAADDFIFV